MEYPCLKKGFEGLLSFISKIKNIKYKEYLIFFLFSILIYGTCGQELGAGGASPQFIPAPSHHLPSIQTEIQLSAHLYFDLNGIRA